MSFIAKRNSKGSILESNGTGGTLNVISGKVKIDSIKAKKDEGTLKKGDTIEGLQFIFTLADSGNIEGQIYQQASGEDKYGKYITDPNPVAYPLTCSFFLPTNTQCGKAYQELFDNAEALGLPVGLKDGFKAVLNIGENKFTAQLVAKDFTTKVSSLLDYLFDEAEAVTCSTDFPVAYAGGNSGGKSGQSEVEKLADRVKFIESLLTENSVEEKLLTKLIGIDDTLTYTGFIALMFK